MGSVMIMGRGLGRFKRGTGFDDLLRGTAGGLTGDFWTGGLAD